MNYNLPLLYDAAARFGFTVDTRGVWPVMVQGQKAAEYRTHRDMLAFISILPATAAARDVRFTVKAGDPLPDPFTNANFRRGQTGRWTRIVRAEKLRARR